MRASVCGPSSNTVPNDTHSAAGSEKSPAPTAACSDCAAAAEGAISDLAELTLLLRARWADSLQAFRKPGAALVDSFDACAGEATFALRRHVHQAEKGMEEEAEAARVNGEQMFAYACMIDAALGGRGVGSLGTEVGVMEALIAGALVPCPPLSTFADVSVHKRMESTLTSASRVCGGLDPGRSMADRHSTACYVSGPPGLAAAHNVVRVSCYDKSGQLCDDVRAVDVCARMEGGVVTRIHRADEEGAYAV